MIAEWVTKGAEIGITAFFCLFVFVLCLGALAGLIALFGVLFSAADNEKL